MEYRSLQEPIATVLTERERITDIQAAAGRIERTLLMIPGPTAIAAGRARAENADPSSGTTIVCTMGEPPPLAWN